MRGRNPRAAALFSLRASAHARAAHADRSRSDESDGAQMMGGDSKKKINKGRWKKEEVRTRRPSAAERLWR